MSGARLGMIFETVAMFGFGIVLGLLFSWQLTLIVFIGVTILLILTETYVKAQEELSDSNRVTFGQASSVRADGF